VTGSRPFAVELVRCRPPVVEHIGWSLTRCGHESCWALTRSALRVIRGLAASERVPRHTEKSVGSVTEMADKGDSAPAGTLARFFEDRLVELSKHGE
jgi:hypothetical protein